MKKFLILTALAFVCNMANAENYALKVNLQGPASAIYVLSDKPVISYSGSNLIIKSKSLEDSYPISEVKSLSFEDNLSSVVENVTDGTAFQFINNVFTCEGHEIHVFDMSGRMVASGIESVSLETLRGGVYIVNAGNRSVKVIR